MAQYGAVKNISIYELPIAGGKYHSFRGDGFVLLDTNPIPGNRYKTLEPFISVAQWNTTIDAKWINAPPACAYCKKQGHYKQDCLIRKASNATELRYYRCHAIGHYQYECPILNQPYDSITTQKSTDPQTLNTNDQKNQKTHTNILNARPVPEKESSHVNSPP
jgi:hypothetical protein